MVELRKQEDLKVNGEIDKKLLKNLHYTQKAERIVLSAQIKEAYNK